MSIVALAQRTVDRHKPKPGDRVEVILDATLVKDSNMIVKVDGGIGYMIVASERVKKP